jgi:hypothetical protein
MVTMFIASLSFINWHLTYFKFQYYWIRVCLLQLKRVRALDVPKSQWYARPGRWRHDTGS